MSSASWANHAGVPGSTRSYGEANIAATRSRTRSTNALTAEGTADESPASATSSSRSRQNHPCTSDTVPVSHGAMVDLASAASRLRAVIDRACTGLVQREAAVQLVVLGAVAREHVLLVGPPGTAKSEAVRRVAHGLGGRYFEYLVGRFTEPAEIFGPVDLEK